MGNAAETLYKKKQERRKKETEEERKIFQACLEWSIKQEENRKHEALVKREKAWKDREITRLKRDKELMQRYITSIESGKKHKEGDLKDREKMMDERKKLTSSISERKMRQREEHWKEESLVMAKNLELIEKRSEKSREAMKMRIVTLAKKKDKDKKEFIHRTTRINQERRKEMEYSRRRIENIEKRIVQDRVQWQAKLMAARGIDIHGKRVSSRQLWEIGRKTVEKKRMEYLKTTESNKDNQQHATKKPETKQQAKRASHVVRKTLSTVKEEDVRKSQHEEENDVTQNAFITRGYSDKVGSKRFYVPQSVPTIHKNLSDSLDTDDSSSSTNVSLNRGLAFGPGVPNNHQKTTSRHKVKPDIIKSHERHVQAMKSSINKLNTQKYQVNVNGVQNPTSKTRTTKQVHPTEQKTTEHMKRDTDNVTNTDQPRNTSDVFSRLFNHESRGGQPKQKDGADNTAVRANQTPRNKKTFVGLYDPLIGNKKVLKQPEVEKILDIKPLSINSGRSVCTTLTSRTTNQTPTMTSPTTRTPPKMTSQTTRNTNPTPPKMTSPTTRNTNETGWTTSQIKIHASVAKNMTSELETGHKRMNENKEKVERGKQNKSQTNLSESKSIEFKLEFSTVQNIQAEKDEDSVSKTSKTSSHKNEKLTFNDPNNGKRTTNIQNLLNLKDQMKNTVAERKADNSQTVPIDVIIGKSGKVPVTSRTNLYLNSSRDMFILDKRISEVQRRIDTMVKSNAGSLNSPPRTIPVS